MKKCVLVKWSLLVTDALLLLLLVISYLSQGMQEPLETIIWPLAI